MTERSEIRATEQTAPVLGGTTGPGLETAPVTDSRGIRLLTDDRIEMIPVSQLTPYQRNARTHTCQQLRQIADSIKRFGFNNPVLVDAHNQIIAGHGRVEAAKLLGLTAVPTLRLSHMSATEVRAYIIADNRLAEQAGWDREVLAAELECLIDLDFDVEVVGFDAGEIEILLEDTDNAGEAAGPEDRVAALMPGTAVSRVGDLWILDQHRIVCGDAGDNGVYELLLDGEKAGFIFTAPYNIGGAAPVGGKDSVHHRALAMTRGAVSAQDSATCLEAVVGQLVAHSTDGSIHQICVDWRHLGEMLAAGHKAYAELKDLCVWVKKNARSGNFYRSRHELVLVWQSGGAPHSNTFNLGQRGRSRSNVWQYADISSGDGGRVEQVSMHPTTMPVALVADALKDCSHRNGVVLDPFLGAGTTLIAAERTGRRGRGIERDPLSVDSAVRRWQTYTSKVALLAATGQSFAAIEAERAGPATAVAGEVDLPTRGEAA